MKNKLSDRQSEDLFNFLAHGDDNHRTWLRTAIGSWSIGAAKPEYIPSAPVPLPMILTCPSCGVRHIDKGLFATEVHHTHACQGCGMVWRPAVAPTVGVQFLPGYKDEPNEAS